MLRSCCRLAALALPLWAVSLAAQEPSPPVDPAEAAKATSIVVFSGTASSGTGFVVSTEGHIVTAWHVILALEERYRQNTGLYLPHLFSVSIRGPKGTCPGTAALVGVSEPQDLAVLQFRPSAWAARDKDECLSRLQPVQMHWDEAALERDLRADPNIVLIGIDADCWKRMADHRWSCLRGENRTFSEIRVDGTITTAEAPYVGMSGGIALHPSSGKVVGLIVSGERLGVAGAGTNDRTIIKPMTTLRRAFWTFGIVPDDTMRDYVDDLRSILASADKLEQLVSLYPMLIEEMNAPIWSRELTLTDNTRFGGKDISIQFKKKSKESADPDYFVVVRRCGLERPTQLASAGSNHDGTQGTVENLFQIPAADHPAVIKAETQPYGSELFVPSYMRRADGVELPKELSRKGRIGQAGFDDLSLQGIIALKQTTEDLRQDCADYYTEIARETDQDISVEASHITQITLLPRAYFFSDGGWRYYEGDLYTVTFE